MQSFPHHYEVRAEASEEGAVSLQTEDLPALPSLPPPQFGGPGGHWAPETLFVAAVVDCFILTFRAIARASKLSWESIDCRVEGTVDRDDGGTQFTALGLQVHLRIPAGGDSKRAEQLLEKAKRGCLVTNSLKREPSLAIEVSSS